MDEEKYTQLITAHLEGSLTDSDLNELNEWLNASLENRETFNELKKVWELTDADEEVSTDTKSAFSKFEAAMDRVDAEKASGNPIESKQEEGKVVQLQPWKWAMRIAASVVVLIGVWLGYEAVTAENTIVVATSSDQEQRVELPDGSVVWVNRNSELQYAESFTDRWIALKGEAFFEVVKNPESPFVVETEFAQTTVLGTSFNVKSPRGEAASAISVVTGKVSVFHNKTKQSVTITKGEQAIVSNQSEVPETSNYTSRNFISWKTDSLNFAKEPLSRISEALSNHYGQIFKVATPGLGNCGFTGIFVDQPLNVVIETFETQEDLVFTQTPNGWEITGPLCN